ncbi:hypothetical protein G6F68_015708 [Rhizopus microsporus]|nr:hypothetical protein G6F68_015708 [Rhizopus microsporus]
MRTWRCATASAPSSILCELPSARSGPEGTQRIGTLPEGGKACGSNQGLAGKDSCVVKFQSCANTDISCVTIGPSTRKCVSRLVASPANALTKAARTFIPPVKPTRPSITSTLRWLRRFAYGMRSTPSGFVMKRATGTPPRASMRTMGGREYLEPMASISTRTSTPRWRASISACASSRPIASLSKI